MTIHISLDEQTIIRAIDIREWLHVARTEHPTWYDYHKKMGKSEAINEMLIRPLFAGTMIHDFWAPYSRYPCCHAVCNAYRLLRELKRISENYHHARFDKLHALLLEIKGEINLIREQSSSPAAPKIANFKD